MNLYDKIYEIAADDFGLITAAAAKTVGASQQDMHRLMKSGRLIRIGRGVYQIYHHIPEDKDSYAAAVKLAGPDAYLFGESVLALHHLCPTNPTFIYVATPHRIRRTLPEHLIVKKRSDDKDVTSYEGIPSQTVYEAILFCRDHIEPGRLLEAAENADNNGLIRPGDYEKLQHFLRKDPLLHETTQQQTES